MDDRRNYVMKVATSMVTTDLLPDSGHVKANGSSMKNIFVHHVFFWLKEPNNQELRTQFKKGLQQLITIPLLKNSHIGRPVESAREVVDDSFTYSFIAFFRNKEDQDKYQIHPIHIQFIEDCQHLWNKVVVYDAMD